MSEYYPDVPEFLERHFLLDQEIEQGDYVVWARYIYDGRIHEEIVSFSGLKATRVLSEKGKGA